MIKKFLASLLIFISMLFSSFALPSAAFAATCDSNFLGIPAWYNGLTTGTAESGCQVISPSDYSGGLSGFIWRIVLNFVDIGLNLVGYLTFIFIIYGAFQYLTSSGDSSSAAKGRTTIVNSIVGAIIAFGAAAIVGRISEVTQGASTAKDVVVNVLNLAYQVGILIAIVTIVIAGLRMIFGGDNSNNVAKARSSIVYAIVGLVILALAYAITGFVGARIK